MACTWGAPLAAVGHWPYTVIDALIRSLWSADITDAAETSSLTQCVGHALSDSGPGAGRHVPTAVLSRQTAGLRGRALILNLPGKPKAIRETIAEVRCFVRRRPCRPAGNGSQLEQGKRMCREVGCVECARGLPVRMPSFIPGRVRQAGLPLLYSLLLLLPPAAMRQARVQM